MKNGRADAQRMFRAFSDRTRLRILHLLRGGELCVCDLMSALRIPQAKTSRHLAYLRRAGLVKSREEGPWSYYSLVPPRDRFHRALMGCLSACFGGRAKPPRNPKGCCPS